MKILLINPPTGIQEGFPNAVAVPYGLLFIASVLERAGHKVTIYDENVDIRSLEELMSFNPAVVGFSVLTGPSILRAVQLSQNIKQKNPSIKIIWGGVHASLLPEQTIQNDYIDYIVIGEGEVTILGLIQYIENLSTISIPLERIQGLCYKKDGKIIRQDRTEFINDLEEELPDPVWHLIDVKKYIRLDKESNLYRINLCTSRGCPYNCAFCYNQAFNKNRKYAAFSAERIIRWIEYFKENYGIEYFKFWEDNFTVDRRRLRDFCRLLLDNKLNIKWECESRPDLKDADLELMANSGCNIVEFGIESGSPKILKFIQKGINLEKVEHICNRCREIGLKVGLYFMVGIPTETIEDFKLTLSLIKRLNYFGIEYMFYRPYPGTQLYEYSVDKGLFTPPQSISEWANSSELYTVDNNLSDIPTEMIQKEMKKFLRYYGLRQALYVVKYKREELLKFLLSPKSAIKNFNAILRQIFRNL